MTTKDTYDHVGESFRYFLGWRHKLFAGYLAVLAAIAVAGAWTQPSLLKPDGALVPQSALQTGVERALPWTVIAVSLVFWMAEFRNRDLWRGCQFVGYCLEQNLPHQRGIYTHLREIETRGAIWGISHGSAMDLLTALVISVAAAYIPDEATLPCRVLVGSLVFVVSFAISIILGKNAKARRHEQEKKILTSTQRQGPNAV